MYRVMTVVLVWAVITTMAAAQNEFKKPKSEWENYYKNATVGDFVEYVNQDGTPNNRKEVTAIGDHRISVTYTNWLDAKHKNEFKQTWVFTEADPKIPELDEVKASTDVVKILGKEIACEKKEFWSKFGPKRDKPTRTEWRSDKVPFDGLVRLEQFTKLELSNMKYAKAPK